MNTATKIIDAIKESSGKSEISLDDRLSQDLGLDSLDQYELVMELEDVILVEISDDMAEKFHTVRDVVERVANLAQGGRP